MIWMPFILPEKLTRWQVALGFLAVALLAFPFGDFAISGHDPMRALGDMASGFLRPDFGAVDDIGTALLFTVMFAIGGVAVGALGGLLLTPFYGTGPVRGLCIFLRSIHELFWALLLISALGIGAPVGVLAIALPYAGIFAKVFAEYFEEADQRPSRTLPAAVDPVSRFLYARLPLVLPQMRTYVLYRVECGLRSSAVLGFVGLPTMGFQLDSFFRQGDYGAASAILILYIVLIASIRFWMRWQLFPIWIGAAFVVLINIQSPPMGEGALWRFLTNDIVPAPLRDGWNASAYGTWLWDILGHQALPGLVATLICAQIALAFCGVLAVMSFGLIVPKVSSRTTRFAGHLGLVIARSIPEYMLAYLFLQAFGPSMLPAVLALGIHNGAIIAHLLGRQGEEIVKTLRLDAPKGVALLSWELVPRLFGQFVALCLYRWEIILRETAVMGLLGVATLGFFIDAAVSELRMDRVVVLLIVGVLLIALIDGLSRWIRGRIGVQQMQSRASAKLAT